MTTRTNQCAAALLALCVGGGAVTAQASIRDLLDTLEQNQTITAEQAASLRAKTPAYTVRPAGRAVQNLAIRGRIQTQFGYVDAKNNEGSDQFSTFEVRRARIGLRGSLAHNVRAQLEANLVPGSSLSMRSAFLQWREHKPAYVKLGMDKPVYGFEENTSSASILTIERSLISNTLVPGTMNGLSLEGTLGMLSYGAGIYTDRDNPNQDGSDDYLYNASVGLSLDDLLPGSKLALRADYISSDDDGGNFGASFEDAMAFSVHFAHGDFDLRAEYMSGSNNGDDTDGFYITPSMYFTDNLQAVVRFEQASSDKARGLRAPSRYVRRVGDLAVRETKDDSGDVISKTDPQRGDDYQALYAGLNYYFAGDGHKVMFGVERSELKNTDAGKLEATSVMTAWRMLF